MFVSFLLYENYKQITLSSQIFLFESVSQKSKMEERNMVQMVVKIMKAVASKEDIFRSPTVFLLRKGT